VVFFTLQPHYPWGQCPGTHLKGSCVGPRVRLDVVVKRKILASARNRSLDVRPMASRFAELSRLTVSEVWFINNL
jgi:hypothetical protein